MRLAVLRQVVVDAVQRTRLDDVEQVRSDDADGRLHRAVHQNRVTQVGVDPRVRYLHVTVARRQLPDEQRATVSSCRTTESNSQQLPDDREQ